MALTKLSRPSIQNIRQTITTWRLTTNYAAPSCWPNDSADLHIEGACKVPAFDPKRTFGPYDPANAEAGNDNIAIHLPRHAASAII